jgi:hypothetical protein
METWFLSAGMALCLFSLVAIARRDWVRLTTISRQVEADVIGHRKSSDSDGINYGAIYRFTAEGGEHEVTDEMLHGHPAPPLGTKVKLTYPFGRPDLAHVSRPWLCLAIYALLLWLLGLLAAKALGRLA